MWHDLTPVRCYFRCHGPDAATYLNGQLSQDVRRVSAGLSLPACLTTAKGKLDAVVWITALPDHAYLIDAPAALHQAVEARLNRYLVADDCEIEDVTGQWIHWHDPDATSPPPPGAAFSPASARLGQTGRDAWIPSDRAAGLPATPPAGSQPWHDLRITRGTPDHGSEWDTDTLPPEVLLDHSAIDYHKGCYTGQEVISRLRSVGQVRRLLRHAVPSAPLPPLPLVLHPADAAPGAPPVGTLTSVRSDGLLALAMVRRPWNSPGSRLVAIPPTPTGESPSEEIPLSNPVEIVEIVH